MSFGIRTPTRMPSSTHVCVNKRLLQHDCLLLSRQSVAGAPLHLRYVNMLHDERALAFMSWRLTWSSQLQHVMMHGSCSSCSGVKCWPSLPLPPPAAAPSDLTMVFLPCASMTTSGCGAHRFQFGSRELSGRHELKGACVPCKWSEFDGAGLSEYG